MVHKTLFVGVMICLAAAGCTRRDTSLTASGSASAAASAGTAPAASVSASANVGDSIAAGIHDKLDRASAAGKAVEDSAKRQEEAAQEATNGPAKP